MSNRSVREGVVKQGVEARILCKAGRDMLRARASWFPEGIASAAMAEARADARNEEPEDRKTAIQWFKEFCTFS